MQIQLNNLTIEDKLKLIEFIWNDLLKTEKDVPSPDWHKDELLVREKRVKENKEKILSWQEAKKDILKIVDENKNS
ncbi:MAG: addiction module protein [Thermodesulfobacterium sp.]|nr:addiction module protein [Thermodesulfobacterium sp.]MCD6548535.1 addiction module protein [Thermodesulfobacterium sp.]